MRCKFYFVFVGLIKFLNVCVFPKRQFLNRNFLLDQFFSETKYTNEIVKIPEMYYFNEKVFVLSLIICGIYKLKRIKIIKENLDFF